MGGRATRSRGGDGRRAATSWSWGSRAGLVAAAVGCTAFAVDVHGVSTIRGIGLALLVSTAGAPLPGVVQVQTPWLWRVAHVLFWAALASWALVRLRRAPRRWRRRHLQSGNPARREAAQERVRRH